MRKLWFVASLFSLASWLGPGNASFAQQDPGSLLGTIINEAVRQGARPADDSPYYGYDPQDPDDYYNDRYYDTRQGRRVTCESRSGQYNYCRTNIRGRVRLDRQLSDAPCRKYDTWGADGDGSGIWVSDGCRAVFVVEPRRPEPIYGGRGKGGRGGRTLTCESRSGQYNYCPTNSYGRVRLDRQLSDAPCREYDTWGSDGDGSGIWVSDGCRAVFVVEPFRYGGYGDEQYGRGRTFTCQSEGYKHNYCRSGARGGRIRLVRQLSEEPCREYETWGSDRDGGGVWVDQGCAAEFSVD
jgi:hypothetical protein